MRPLGPHARFWMLLGLMGLFAPALAGVTLPGGPREVTLQLKWYPQFQFAGYYAAQRKGFYEAAGVEVKLRPGGRGINPVNEVLSGRARFGIGDSDLLLARAKGEPIVVLAAVFQHSPYILLTRAEDHLARPSDLAGKTVMAMEDQGAAQLRAMLRAEGVSPGKVRIIRHSWDLQDLVSKKVDGMTAYLTVEPYQLEKLGVPPGILSPGDYGIDFYGDCLFTTEDEIRERPDEVEAVLQATRQGWVEAMRNPAEVIPWILETPGVRERGIGSDNLAYEARAMQPLVLADIVPVGHINPDRWQRILEAYQNLGLVPRTLKLEGFLYRPAVKTLSPRAMRWVWISLLALAALIVAGFVWIASLRRAVRAQTLELRNEHARLQLAQHAVDQARDYISWVDEDGRYLYGNRILLDLYGLTLEELRQRRIWTQIPGMGEAAWRQIWQEISVAGVRRGEATLVSKDGSGVPVEILSTLVETGGRKIACNFTRDLTESLRAEQERLERERQVALVLEGTGVGYWDWRIPTGELAMDATIDRVLGYAPAALPRRISTWTDHLHTEDRERTFAILQPFLEGDLGVYEAEFRLQRQDGSWVWVSARGRVTELGPDGKAARIQGILQDIDERKRKDAGLHQVQRLESLGLLAGGIAHDFNNLLTAVLGNLNLARIGLPPSDRAAAHLQRAEEAVQKAAGLTRQLLAYSGKGRLEVGPVDLNAVVVQMQDLLAVGLPKDITLETRLDPEPPFIEGDSTQIQQVVLNLITNAAEAIATETGRITVETGVEAVDDRTRFRLPSQESLPPGRYAVLTVADTGAGMAPAVQARIFDPFFSTKTTGRGLGLSALLGILRGHRGGIQIQSAPGEGTAFRLFFPLRAAASAPRETGLPAAELELKGEVLLADDEPAVLEAGSSLLEALGFTVIRAEDGEAAISCFLEHLDRIRLVILDQTMPRMSGTDTFRAIRRLKPELPVILTSGFSEEEVGDVLQAEGLDGFLQKPYRLADLERVVRKVLRP